MASSKKPTPKKPASKLGAKKPVAKKAVTRKPAAKQKTVAAMKNEEDALAVLAKVCADRARRTCIEVSRTKTMVRHIPLNVSSGLHLHEMEVSEFDRIYSPLEDYPVGKGAALYASYAPIIGATAEAIDALGEYAAVSGDARTAAIERMSGVGIKVKRSKTDDDTPRAVRKTPSTARAKATKTPKAKDGKKRSAAAAFREYIMLGTMTDEQIFSKVQSEFGLPDSRRTYVSWYRKELNSKGMNVPPAK